MIIKRKKSVLHENKKCETCGIKNKDGECCLAYTNVKDDLLEYICLCCDRNYRKNFDEIISGERRFLQSHVNMEDIIDADYGHTKTVCKNFKTRNLGEYHDLYVQSKTVLVVHIFNNFRNVNMA